MLPVAAALRAWAIRAPGLCTAPHILPATAHALYRAYGPGSGIMYPPCIYCLRRASRLITTYGMNVSLDSVGRVRREPSPGVLFALSGVKIGNVPSPIRRIQPEAHITMKS